MSTILIRAFKPRHETPTESGRPDTPNLPLQSRVQRTPCVLYAGARRKLGSGSRFRVGFEEVS